MAQLERELGVALFERTARPIDLAAEVLREGGCVTPTAAWTEPLDGLAFRPVVDATPLVPWSLARRADVAELVECAHATAAEQGWR